MKFFLLALLAAVVYTDDSRTYYPQGGGGYNRVRYQSRVRPGYGYGNVATGSYAVKRNYGGYGKGGYQRGGSLDYAQSYNCRARGGYGYSAQLWCGEGYQGFACSLETSGYGHRSHHHQGGHRGHGYPNAGYRGYRSYRKKRSIGFVSQSPQSYGSTTCWRRDGKKLSCQQTYGGHGGYGGGYGGGSYKCTAKGTHHYGTYNYRSQGGHGGRYAGGYGGGYAGGHHGAAVGGGYGYGSYGSPTLHHNGRAVHGYGFNPKYGGKNYHLGIPFGLNDVEKTGKDETDKNANKCKKECWINRHGKQNCKIKCCNWQCPQVCTTDACCNTMHPDTDDNAECKANLLVNQMSCRFSCYVKLENLDQKEGKYHVSETYGRYQNAQEQAVKNAFVGYAEFYKEQNDKTHLGTATLLTEDEVDGSSESESDMSDMFDSGEYRMINKK